MFRQYAYNKLIPFCADDKSVSALGCFVRVVKNANTTIFLLIWLIQI